MLNVAVCAFSSTGRCTDQTRSFPCAVVSSATVYISDRLSASDCTELCVVCPPPAPPQRLVFISYLWDQHARLESEADGKTQREAKLRLK